MSDLVGKSFTFEDGARIEVIQVKTREVNNVSSEYITYTVVTGNSLPRKLVMEINQFKDNYGHLF
jgi:hypothetical protein